MNAEKHFKHWIKGHSGLLRNNADDFATKGASMEIMGPKPIVPIPFNKIKEITWTNHRNYWEIRDGCRQEMHSLHLIQSYPAGYSGCVGDLRKNCGLITEHCSMDKHLFTLGLLCKECLTHEEILLQVLTECKELINKRTRFLGDKKTQGNYWKPWKSFGPLEWAGVAGGIVTNVHAHNSSQCG